MKNKKTNKADLYCNDCFDAFKKIDDSSVDLIITSPPYNLGNNHHTGNKKHQAYNDNLPEKEYQETQIRLLDECFRVLKDNGSMIYNHKNRIKKGIQISPYEWLFKSKFVIKQELLWVNRSQNFDKIRFYPWTERIYWLTKNPKTKLINTINKHDVFDWNEWKPVGTRGLHTRAFPEKFVADMLLVFPNAKTVLDPYMGSGTTGYVALNDDRNFIGFELNEEYFNIAKNRMQFL
jgi:site-specific DNA-methyltransferase (adenine-specific)